MPYYVSVGSVPRKRHTLHRHVDGRPLNEELIGQEGFSSHSSLLYHLNSPSAIDRVESVEIARSPIHSNQPLLPWHLRASEIPPGGDLVTGRHTLLSCETVTICYASADANSELYRNAIGDELLFIQAGKATLESAFGRLVVSAGDYVVVPGSTTHRWIIDPQAAQVQALVLEAKGHVGLPERYLTKTGQLREGAPFCERDIRPPGDLIVLEGEDVPVLVRTRNGWSEHHHSHHPFDVVGWDGCLYPFALSISDFEPIVGRIHQPPPVHQTFVGQGFVVCSFVPRPFDFDPSAVKVPYHHANVDSDEILFYVSGDFMSRRGAGIGAGSLTVHPAGFVHGPHPGSRESSDSKDRTEETAVMIDCFSQLAISEVAKSVSDPVYFKSWSQE